MAIQHLAPHQLRRACNPAQFAFETTSELDSITTLIGQSRAVRAIEFSAAMPGHSYNVYALTDSDVASAETIARHIETVAQKRPTPNDWVYVHNFDNKYRPISISLPPGTGQNLKDGMKELIEQLKDILPDSFEEESYRVASDEIRDAYRDERNNALVELRERAAEDDMTVVASQSGYAVRPLIDGRAMGSDEYNQLPIKIHHEIEQIRTKWDDKLDDMLRDLRKVEDKSRDQLNELDKRTAEAVCTPMFESLRSQFSDSDEVIAYLDAAFEDILDSLPDFFESESGDERPPSLHRYEVNVVVDNGDLAKENQGAPVIVERMPSFVKLLGQIEAEPQNKLRFNNIQAGSLHRANGGFLILYAKDITSKRTEWDTLKRALRDGQILVQTPDLAEGGPTIAKTIDPMPIPLDVRIVLVGSTSSFYRLSKQDKDFSDLFKSKAEFTHFMERTPENELLYARYVATVCADEQLRPFSRSGVAAVVELGSRLARHQNRLSTRFELLNDFLHESHYWAGVNDRCCVGREDVKAAVTAYVNRLDLDVEYLAGEFDDGMWFVSTAGEIVGQVNGLSVLTLSDFSYGQPSRITAQTFQGDLGIVNIDREVELTGPIHNKGILTLIGYLGAIYAQDQPITLSASVSFEQNYSMIDGDSASSAELYAILSSLGELPIKQYIAVTGSVNQRGEIQPIGGAIEKAEGFFQLCQARGLTGDQGVIIPAVNIKHLMLSDELVEAVENGQFHIWAVDMVEDGMELLTGVKAAAKDENGDFPVETLHARVMEGIERLCKDEDDDDEDDDDLIEAESSS